MMFCVTPLPEVLSAREDADPESSKRRAPRKRPGTPATHGKFRVVLLRSRPDTIGGFPLRRTRTPAAYAAHVSYYIRTDYPCQCGRGQPMVFFKLSFCKTSGKRMSGVICYQVPVDFEVFEINYSPNFWGNKKVTFSFRRDNWGLIALLIRKDYIKYCFTAASNVL